MFLFHLLVDAVKIFCPADNVHADAGRFKPLLDMGDKFLGIFFTLGPLFCNAAANFLVRLRLEYLETKVFEFAFHRTHAKLVRDGRVNLCCFPRNAPYFFRPEAARAERAHVVQTIGKFDENDAHVLCSCKENFPDVFCGVLFF